MPLLTVMIACATSASTLQLIKSTGQSVVMLASLVIIVINVLVLAIGFYLSARGMTEPKPVAYATLATCLISTVLYICIRGASIVSAPAETAPLLY